MKMMKKNMLALSVMAGLISTSAFAGTGSVYGKADAGFNSTSGFSSLSSNSTVSSNDSYVGFAGSESIGSAKVFTDLEFNVALAGNQVDSKGTPQVMLTRNAFVGVEGPYGTLKAGSGKSINFELTEQSDMFFGHAGSLSSLISTNNVFNYGYGSIEKNVIGYKTPSFSGVKLFAQTTTPGNDSTGVKSTEGSAYVAGVEYENHNLFGALAYNNVAAGNKLTKDANSLMAVGGWTNGNVRVNGTYYTDKVEAVERNVYGVGVGYKFGANEVKGQIATVNLNNSLGSANLYAIGLDHNYSKNVMAYANFAMVSNGTSDNGSGSYSSNGSLSTDQPMVVAGKDNSTFSVGLKYKF
jgi:predicted porin